MKLVGLILILYFDEDHGSFRIVVGFEKNKNIRSLYFITGGLYFGFDHCAVVMLPEFQKKKKK